MSSTNTQHNASSTYPTDMVVAFLVFLCCLIFALFENHEFTNILASHP